MFFRTYDDMKNKNRHIKAHISVDQLLTNNLKKLAFVMKLDQLSFAVRQFNNVKKGPGVSQIVINNTARLINIPNMLSVLECEIKSMTRVEHSDQWCVFTVSGQEYVSSELCDALYELLTDKMKEVE